jgi:hypothetical protein
MNKLALGALGLSLMGGCADPEISADRVDVPRVTDGAHEEVLVCAGDEACFGLSEIILGRIGEDMGSIPAVTDECRFALAKNVAECMAVEDSLGGVADDGSSCIGVAADKIDVICGK